MELITSMLFSVFSVLLCGIWVYALLYMRRSVANMPMLHRQRGAVFGEPKTCPLVSIIVPACNEARQLEAALTSLLSLDYPRLELVVIDDRSTDRTGEIIDRLASSDPRIVPIHIESLPNGWLGKVHALHKGVQRANGDWYLFTDADVHFERAALRRALGYARTHGLNHLTCVPQISAGSFLLAVVIRSFFLMFSFTVRLAQINRQASKHSVGIGAFNLVEAATFDRSPGFEWLRMDPADDLGLGVLLKQAGARTGLLNGDGQICIEWYHSVGDLIRGLEKNSFGPAAHYSYLRQLAIVVYLCCLVAAPPLTLVIGLRQDSVIMLTAGSIAYLVSVAVASIMPRKSPADLLAYLLMPFGILLIAWIMIRSAYLCLRNGGIEWRGTRYTVAELRRGQRVRF